MRAEVLIVEDDAALRHALRLSLSNHGYTVLEAGTGSEGLRLLRAERPDLVLLDLMLPDVDGFAVCRTIRAETNTPIIIISARGDDSDIVTGLDAGADDYVTKPLVGKGLAARIKAVLRRSCLEQPGERFSVGDLELLPDQAVVRKRGVEVNLTRTEFRLLCELLANQGDPVSRETLLQRVWSYDYFGDTRLLDVHVRRLRTKIEDDPAQPSYVLTERGVGYRIARDSEVEQPDEA